MFFVCYINMDMCYQTWKRYTYKTKVKVNPRLAFAGTERRHRYSFKPLANSRTSGYGRFTLGEDPVSNVREAGWAPGPVWTQLITSRDVQLLLHYSHANLFVRSCCSCNSAKIVEKHLKHVYCFSRDIWNFLWYFKISKFLFHDFSGNPLTEWGTCMGNVGLEGVWY
jgi:hypothetical protein